MKLIDFKKVKDGKFLKNYELIYENKAGKEKTYEIVSHRELSSTEDLGSKTSGISIVAFHKDKMLLLREFRMGVNRYIYNLCAGMLEPNETIEECIRRELYEETGLNLKTIIQILRPSFAAVSLTDITNQIVLATVEGDISFDHTSANEDIMAGFYTKEEMQKLVEEEWFSSRAQLAAYSFAVGAYDMFLEEQK